jgi:HSP20 family protein
MATTLTRWRPFENFGELQTRFDRVFEDLVADGRRRDWTPALDVITNRDNLVVRADMPGVKPEEIRIQVSDDTLTVSGEHEETKEEKEENFIRRERRYGSFSRSIALPAGVEADKIDATYKDGVLEVTIPTPEATKAAPIEIKPKAA